MTQADVDARVGWADAYCAKLEGPHRAYGRRVAGLFTAALFDWLEGLGLALVLVDAADAAALGGAQEVPAAVAPTRGMCDSRKRSPLVTHTLLTRITVAT